MEHLYNAILLSRKKEENFTLCDSMTRPAKHMLSKIRQSEKANIIQFHSDVESNKQTELTSKIKTEFREFIYGTAIMYAVGHELKHHYVVYD